jgi:hypothetical protein
LAQSYRSLLCPESKPDCGGADAFRHNGTLLEKCLALQARQQLAGRKAVVCPEEERSNALYEGLQSGDTVSGHAEQLFGRSDPEFVARTTEIARSFVDNRVAMHRLLLASLEMLETAPNETLPRVARTVAWAVQVGYLSCFLEGDASREWTDAGTKQRLRLALAASKGAGRAQAVEQEALRAPKETAALLRWVDSEVTGLPEGKFKPCSTDRFWADSSRFERSYGLGRGPSKDAVEALKTLGEELGTIDPGNALGFEKGRLPDGIDKLTRSFLEALDQHNHQIDGTQAQAALARLEEALLVFAERVLFVTNNTTYSWLSEELLFPRRSADPYADGNATARPATGVPTIESLAARMAVLQTLGNTLVLHANDLRRHRQHVKTQQDASAGELRAAQAALQPGADLAFDALLMHARGELTQRRVQQQRAEGGKSSADGAASDKDSKLKAQRSDLEKQRDEATAVADKYKLVLDGLLALARTVVPAAARADIAAPADQVLAAEDAADANDMALRLATFDKVPPSTATALLKTLHDAIGERAVGAEGPRLARLKAADAVVQAPGTLLPQPSFAPGEAVKTFEAFKLQ